MLHMSHESLHVCLVLKCIPVILTDPALWLDNPNPGMQISSARSNDTNGHYSFFARGGLLATATSLYPCLYLLLKLARSGTVMWLSISCADCWGKMWSRCMNSIYTWLRSDRSASWTTSNVVWSIQSHRNPNVLCIYLCALYCMLIQGVNGIAFI